LTAAFDLAGKVGYARLSIEGIAARAGVGKQTIYRWWPSKGAVLFDAFVARAEGQGVRPLPDTGDLESDLKKVLRAAVLELNDPRYDEPLRALNTEILHDPELATAYAERLEGPVRERRKDRLRGAQRAGQLPEDLDLDIAIDLLWGPLLNRWLQRGAPLTTKYADTLVRTALNGLRGPDRSVRAAPRRARSRRAAG
jgi:AcrR family transcriptional regulator